MYLATGDIKLAIDSFQRYLGQCLQQAIKHPYTGGEVVYDISPSSTASPCPPVSPQSPTAHWQQYKLLSHIYIFHVAYYYGYCRS